MKKSNNITTANTVLKNHQINSFIKGLSGVVSEHPKEFSTVNILLSPKLTIIVGIRDFFDIRYVDNKLKIILLKELPEHIKLKIFQLFDENIY